jgi:hypothetical protein
MHLALDLDDTITAWPAAFKLFAQAVRSAGGTVTIITLRREREAAIADLARHEVPYDRLETPPEDRTRNVFEWKAERCRDLAVDVLIDDMPEIANLIAQRTLVLVPRDPSLGSLTYR